MSGYFEVFDRDGNVSGLCPVVAIQELKIEDLSAVTTENEVIESFQPLAVMADGGVALVGEVTDQRAEAGKVIRGLAERAWGESDG